MEESEVLGGGGQELVLINLLAEKEMEEPHFHTLQSVCHCLGESDSFFSCFPSVSPPVLDLKTSYFDASHPSLCQNLFLLQLPPLPHLKM